jgi:hypothetical protein
MAFPQARVTCLPIPFNNQPLTSVFPLASSPGYDPGSPSSITAWPNVSGAIRIPNNGQVMLFWASGATLPGITQVLVGDPVGNTGTYAPGTTIQATLAASSSGWLGPWSPNTYNIQGVSGQTFSGAINSQAIVAADVGCVLIDFTTTTTLVVRAFTLIPVQP